MIPPIYFVVGPTSIGKSSLAIKLAKKLNGQIINADSMQVYKNLKVLTARPNIDEMKEIKHHLYGHVNATERYNVSRWCEEATLIIKNNFKKKITSILVGGTGMYIDKIINGLIDIPTIPESFKKESEKLLLKEGKENFFKIVKSFDNESVKKINPNDINRLRRVWEVFIYTEIPMSDWKKNNQKNFLNNMHYFLYLFLPDRKKNYQRVNDRFNKMIENGVIKEVKELLKLKLNKSLPVMRAHGVPEIESYLTKKINLEECIEKAKQVTRNYVKRQHTWWGSNIVKNHQKFTEFPDEIDLKSMNLKQN